MLNIHFIIIIQYLLKILGDPLPGCRNKRGYDDIPHLVPTLWEFSVKQGFLNRILWMGVRNPYTLLEFWRGKVFFQIYAKIRRQFFFFLRRGFPASSDYHGPSDPKERKDHWSVKLTLLQKRGAFEPPHGPRWAPKPHGKSEIL